jgi:CubicO group peptidase (beta-lactamase class C family)
MTRATIAGGAFATVFVLLALWVHGSAAVAQGHGSSSLPRQPSDETIAAFVDSYISKAVAGRGIPGAAVVLVKDGRAFFERGYGVGDYESRRPISPEHSVLRQGSTAKLFVWVLVMQLVEEGRLDLDAGVNRYLDFRIPDAFGVPITLRHLMTHTAGFADRVPGGDGESRHAPFAIRVRKLSRYVVGALLSRDSVGFSRLHRVASNPGSSSGWGFHPVQGCPQPRIRTVSTPEKTFPSWDRPRRSTLTSPQRLNRAVSLIRK